MKVFWKCHANICTIQTALYLGSNWYGNLFVLCNTASHIVSKLQHDTCPVCRYSLNKGSIVLGNDSQTTDEEQESMETESIVENQTSMSSGSVIENQA